MDTTELVRRVMVTWEHPCYTYDVFLAEKGREDEARGQGYVSLLELLLHVHTLEAHVKMLQAELDSEEDEDETV